MAAIRELLVEFGVKVDDQDLEQTEDTVDGLVGKLKDFGKGLIAVTGAAGIGLFIKETAEAAATMGDLADQVGLAADTFQVLNLAAELNGASTEDLRITLKALSKNAQSVADGNAGMVKSFKDLNVEVETADGNLKTTDQLLLEVGASLASIENPTERVAKAQTVLGEASLKLLPLLNGSKEELEAYLEELRKLGGGFSKDAIESSRRFSAALAKMQFAFQSLAGELVVLVAPAVEAVTEGISDLIRFTSALFKETKFLRNLFGAGLFVGFMKAKTALLSFTKVIPRLIGLFRNFGIQGLLRGLKSFSPLLARIGRLLVIGARFARKFILPFLLFDDIFTFFEGGDSLIGRFIDALVGPGTAKKFQDGVAKVVEGIKSFVSFLFADDPAARQAALDNMKAAFAEAGALFEDFFGTVGLAIINWLVETWDLFAEAAGIAFNQVTDALGEWLGITGDTIRSFFSDIWNDVVANAQKAFKKVVSFVPSGLLDAVGLGSSGASVSPGSVGGGVNAPQTVNVNQTINANGGQSPQAIGNAANRGVGRAAGGANLRTMRGLTQG